MSAAPLLTIFKNGTTLKTQPVEGEVLLGREEGCVIRLDDRAVSRKHAVFRSVQGGIQVERVSEVAPLSVNGTECTRALVKEGDVIEIGPYLVKVSAPPVVPVSPEQPSVNSSGLAPATGAAPSLESLSPESANEALSLASSGAFEFEEPQVSDRIPASFDNSLSSASVSSFESPSDTASKVDESGEVLSESRLSLIGEMDGDSGQLSGPIDLGEVAFIDGEAQTRLISSEKISAKIIFPDGTATPAEISIGEKELTIGRGKDCDVVLDEKKASRKHCSIRRSGAEFILKDLESSNGTYLNGSQITEHHLSGGDVIRVGALEFRFVASSKDYEKKKDSFLAVSMAVTTPSSAMSAEVPQQVMPASLTDSPQLMQPLPDLGAPSLNPHQSGLTGIAGVSDVSSQKQSLLQKFAAFPPRKKLIYGAAILAVIYFALPDFDEEKVPASKAKAQTVVGKNADLRKPVTFESLSAEQKKFVESQHSLAYDYFTNKDFDKALFELQKLFAVIPDYKDSLEIKRYAEEGKKRLGAIEEEKRRRAEEEKLKARVAEFESQAKGLMDSKNYDSAREFFAQILALDPDNALVADWKKEIEKFEEERRIAEQQKSVQQQINVRAWDVYKEGVALRNAKHYREAIETFKRVGDLGAADPKPEKLAKAQVREISILIAKLRDPVISEAKQAEANLEFSKAFELFRQATEIDPPDPTGYAGMARIRGILHERAKAVYIDAVLAESYSDFETAKKKFQEVKEVAPKDDIYFERAERKLAVFFRQKEEAAP